MEKQKKEIARWEQAVESFKNKAYNDPKILTTLEKELEDAKWALQRMVVDVGFLNPIKIAFQQRKLKLEEEQVEELLTAAATIEALIKEKEAEIKAKEEENFQEVETPETNSGNAPKPIEIAIEPQPKKITIPLQINKLNQTFVSEANTSDLPHLEKQDLKQTG
jgi:hypothetical protein